MTMGSRYGWVLAAALCSPLSMAGEWSGSVGFEGTWFARDPLFAEQFDNNLSLSIEPEYFHDWDSGNQRLVIAPFVRADLRDKERTHADLREAYWQRSFDSVELAVGLRRVFWGVTESAHLVDIINQTDFVENIDGEDKLGQPMVSVRWLPEWGTLDLFLMPLHRERTFASLSGRPRLPFPIDQGAAQYESSRGDNRLDVAVRYSHFFGDFDVGVAHFSGTMREPRFAFTFDPTRGPVLIPNYDRLEQTSLDLQATKGDTLWKLEMISRHNFDGRSTAVVAGLEHTLTGVFDTAIDLGLIAEYLFDDQPALRTSTRNDMALGARLAFNDVQDSALLAFAVVDADTQTAFATVEGNRRLGQSWRLSLEGRFFFNPDRNDFLFGLRDDDYVELTLERFF